MASRFQRSADKKATGKTAEKEESFEEVYSMAGCAPACAHAQVTTPLPSLTEASWLRREL